MWRALWLLVPLLGVSELVAHAAWSRRAPTVAEWRQARATMEALRQDDELVIVAPQWAEPLARHAFGAEAFPLAQVARPDVSGFARAIEVSTLGQRAPELRGWRQVEQRRQGKLTFRFLENPASYTIVYDFVSELGPTETEVIGGGVGPPARCRWRPDAGARTGGLHGHVAFPRQRFICPGSEYFFVGVTVIDDQQYRPRRCIWAHPGPDGTRLRFRDVPLGDRIHGAAGLSWFLMRDGAGPPVTLDVFIDGKARGSTVHHDVDGWTHFEIDTRDQAGTRAEVTFHVSASDIRQRHFCFHADARRVGP